MKILIGYDGSKVADEALNDLRKAGLPEAAQVRIMNIIPPIFPLESLAPTGDGISWYATAYKDLEENQKILEARAKDQVKKAAAILQKFFPSWKIGVKTGEDVPAHGLLTESEKWKPNLIVMGSHGWNAFGKLLLGSVADNVLNHAHCSVRLGKAGKTSGARPPHLLIAYDGSKYADHAVTRVAARVWPKGTRAWILAVSEFQVRLDELSLALLKSSSRVNGTQSVWPWMEKKMAKQAEKLAAAGISVETSLMIGEPRHTLIAQAKKLDVDTIFLGSHGLSGVQRFLLGSVSSAVAEHAPCSVEVIRMDRTRRPE